MTAGSPWVRPTSTNTHCSTTPRSTSRPAILSWHATPDWRCGLNTSTAVEEIVHDPTTVIDGLWRPIAEGQVHRRSNGLALTHRLMQLPAVSRRAERLVGPMRGLLIDG